jgi:hypothetical protein
VTVTTGLTVIAIGKKIPAQKIPDVLTNLTVRGLHRTKMCPVNAIAFSKRTSAE